MSTTIEVFPAVISENTTITGDYDLSSQSGMSTGAVSIVKGIDVTFEDVTLNNYQTTYNLGGVIATANATGTNNITITKSSFSGNSGDEYGGVVFFDNGQLTVTSSEFSNNIAKYYGGALHVDGGSAVISQSTFTGNQTIGKTSTSGGGALSLGGNATVTDTDFSSNSAYMGGAVRVGALKNVEINGSEFKQNTSAQHGAAIFVDSGATLTMSGNVFDTNTATGRSGAIHNNAAFVNDTNSLFVNNKANSTSNTGGVMYIQGGKYKNGSQEFFGGTATFTGSTFFSNSAVDNGGAILSDNAQYVKFSGSTFVQNTSNANGGAIYFHPGNAVYLTVNPQDTDAVPGNIFTGNNAVYGGAIYNNGVVLTANGSLYEYNQASSDGGAIYNTKTIISTDAVFSHNTASGNGGAVYNTGTATFTNAEFTQNSAKEGSAVYNTGSLTLVNAAVSDNNATGGNNRGAIYTSGTLIIDGGEFTGNKGKQGGALATNGTAPVTIKNGALFYGNASSSIGGAIFGGGQYEISGSTFLSNTATSSGGAFFLDWSSSGTAEKTLFQNNSANAGGAIHIASGSLALTGSTFTANSAAQTSGGNGGAILVDQTLTDTKSLFNGNKAYQGGAVYNKGTSILNGSTFSENTTSDGGGAILVSKGSVTVENGVLFDDNDAKKGGAVYVDSAATLVASGSIFSNNSAQHGGAAFVAGSASFSNTLFENNSTTGENGGAIIVDATQAQLSISGSTFAGNSGKSGGAVAYFNDTELNVTNSLFINNTANIDGGAVMIADAPIAENASNMGAVFSGSTFTGNRAAYCGGALYLRGNDDSAEKPVEFVISGSTFSGNNTIGEEVDKDYRGGAVYFMNQYGSLAIEQNTVFDGNSCSEYGGAVFSRSGELNIAKTLFTQNEAWGGGAVYVDNQGTLAVDGSTFAMNKAVATNGGAITFAGTGEAKVENAVFISNSAATSGGAIDACGTVSGDEALTIANSVFEQNAANKYGGAVYVQDQGGNNDQATIEAVNISGSTFSGNVAANRGGALFLKGNGNNESAPLTVNISGSTFTGNKVSTECGGAIYFQNSYGSMTISDSVFDGNSDVEGGGAIWIRQGEATLTGNVKFLTASDTVNVRDGGHLHINNATVALNASLTSRNDGAVIDGTFITVENSTINFGSSDISVDSLEIKTGNTFAFGSGRVSFANQNLSDVAITINTDSFDFASGEAITVATGVSGYDKANVSFSKYNDFFESKLSEGILTYQLKSDNVSANSSGKFVGNNGVNIMTSGTLSNTLFAAVGNETTISTVVAGGKVGDSVIGGMWANAKSDNFAAKEVESVNVVIGKGTEISNYLYGGGFLYGSGSAVSAPQLSTGTVTVDLQQGTVTGDVYGGIHVRDYGVAYVENVKISVSGGNFTNVYGGGFAQTGGVTTVDNVEISVSDGSTIGTLFAGGNNAATKSGYDPALSTVKEALITVSGSADINNIYLSGKYANSAISGTVTLNITGGAIGSVTGSYYGAESENKTKVNVGCNVAGTALENIDVLTIAEGFKFSGSFSDIDNVVFDLGEDGFGGEEWTALTGTALDEAFASTNFTVGDLAPLSLNDLISKGVAKLSDDKTELKIISAQIA